MKMKKLALAVLSLGILAAPASAETLGLNADVNTYKAIAELAQEKNGGRDVTIVTTEQAASSFGGFNKISQLQSVRDPIVQSR